MSSSDCHSLRHSFNYHFRRLEDQIAAEEAKRVALMSKLKVCIEATEPKSSGDHRNQVQTNGKSGVFWESIA